LRDPRIQRPVEAGIEIEVDTAVDIEDAIPPEVSPRNAWNNGCVGFVDVPVKMSPDKVSCGSIIDEMELPAGIRSPKLATE